MYIHIMNERMTLDNGIKVCFCKCKRWTPPLCMGFKDKMIAGMKCREYLCPECCKNLPKGDLTGRPLYTIDEFLAIRNEMAAQNHVTIKHKEE